MNLPNQFINWCEIADLPPKKPRKVPCDANRNPIDPHNPAHWLTLEQAQSTGLNIGFVLTDNDPYFLLDLDDIKTPEGTWDDWSQSIFAQFQNAAWEVSWSGNGAHIMGRCDASRLTDRKNKFADSKGEFYHTKRFVAFGQGLQGDIDIDWTETLLRVVPARDTADSAPVNYTGPVLGWNGPTDDTVLINKAMNAAGSAAVQFGDKASFRDLWNCDVAKLTQVFPSPSGDDFDRSSADAALMSHLAFWTGKDYQRMDRLFRQSGLMREKYDTRPDYQQNTITGAIRHCQNVYTGGNDKITTEERARTDSTLLTVMEQQDYFKGCIYVSGLKKVMTQNGSFLDQQQFRAMYGGKEFMMKSEMSPGKKTTDNAYTAFTENQLFQFPRVENVTFRADLPFQAVLTDADGLKAVNVYQPRTPRIIAGDPGPFVDLVRRLLPDQRDQQILLSYMAAVAQYPGRKFLWAPVVIGTQGNGKSTLINVLQYIVDGIIQGVNDDETKYTLSMTAKHIDDKFNGDMFQKTLVVVHEMHSNGLDFKKEMIRQDYLKQLITEPSITIERKGVDKFNARNVANFFFCSNHKDAIKLEASERRFAVFYTAQQDATDLIMSGMSIEYFVNLWAWLRGDGFAICNHFLKNFTIPDELDPTKGAQKAPRTSATELAIWESRSHTEQLIISAIHSNEQGFKNGWISTLALRHFFENEGEKMPYGKTITRLLNELGYVGGYRSTKMMHQEGGSKTRLYAAKHKLGEISHDGKGWTDVYIREQGYATAPMPTGM